MNRSACGSRPSALVARRTSSKSGVRSPVERMTSMVRVDTEAASRRQEQAHTVAVTAAIVAASCRSSNRAIN